MIRLVCLRLRHIQSYRHQICDFEMRVNEMLAIVVLYYNYSVCCTILAPEILGNRNIKSRIQRFD